MEEPRESKLDLLKGIEEQKKYLHQQVQYLRNAITTRENEIEQNLSQIYIDYQLECEKLDAMVKLKNFTLENKGLGKGYYQENMSETQAKIEQFKSCLGEQNVFGAQVICDKGKFETMLQESLHLKLPTEPVYKNMNDIVWEKSKQGSLRTQLQSPSSIDIDQTNNYVYITDTLNSRIQIFTENGDHYFSLMLPKGFQPLKVRIISSEVYIYGEGNSKYYLAVCKKSLSTVPDNNGFVSFEEVMEFVSFDVSDFGKYKRTVFTPHPCDVFPSIKCYGYLANDSHVILELNLNTGSTGGIFGGGTQGTGLFGGTTPQASLFGGFGTQGTSPFGGTSSFGGTTTQASSFGAFGTQVTSSVLGTTTQPSLFSETTTQGTGLFGTTQGTGLFGTTQGTGLFGTTQGTGLFGTTQGTGLFGTTQGTGLFGTTQGTGLFGTTQGTGLFGTTQGTSLFATTQGTGLFGTTQGTGLFGSAPKISGIFPSTLLPKTSQLNLGLTNETTQAPVPLFPAFQDQRKKFIYLKSIYLEDNTEPIDMQSLRSFNNCTLLYILYKSCQFAVLVFNVQGVCLRAIVEMEIIKVPFAFSIDSLCNIIIVNGEVEGEKSEGNKIKLDADRDKKCDISVFSPEGIELLQCMTIYEDLEGKTDICVDTNFNIAVLFSEGSEEGGMVRKY